MDYKVDEMTGLWGCVESSSVEDFYIAILYTERQMTFTPMLIHSRLDCTDELTG